MMEEALVQEPPAVALELEQRFHLFVASHRERARRLAWRLVGGDDAAAEDVIQEAFIKALQRQDQLKDEQKAANWLSRIATNTAIDFLRRHGRVAFCEMDVHTESEQHSPEELVLQSEHRNYLEDGLRLLTARERAALVLRDVEGCSAEEVARRLDCSKATVRSHIANARIKLRRYMARRKR